MIVPIHKIKDHLALLALVFEAVPDVMRSFLWQLDGSQLLSSLVLFRILVSVEQLRVMTLQNAIDQVGRHVLRRTIAYHHRLRPAFAPN